MRSFTCILFLLLCLQKAPVAFTYHEICGSARLRAMGGAACALAGDIGACYYNPAGITGIDEILLSITLSDWITKMIKSPNYYIDNAGWIPYTEESGWGNLFLPVFAGGVIPFSRFTMAPAVMLIGGWQTRTAEYNRERCCISYSLSFAFDAGAGISIGFTPQAVHMIDMGDEINHAWGWTVAAGVLVRFPGSFTLGASILPPFTMHWQKPELAFMGSDDGREHEPAVIRAGFSCSKPESFSLSFEWTNMLWSLYDGNAADIMQFHLGAEWMNFYIPLRFGIYNEPNPWDTEIQNLFFTAGSSFLLWHFTVDVALEAGLPLSEKTDRVIAGFMSMNYSW